VKCAPVDDPVLRLFAALIANVLSIGHADLLPFNAVVANLLAVGDPVYALGALTFDADVFVTRDLLALDRLLALDALLALGTCRPFRLRHALLAIDARSTFNARLSLDSFGTRRPLDPRLALYALGTLRTFGPLGLRRLPTMFAVRLGACGGRYRQRGNAGGEDHPIKHVLSPFERIERSVSGTVPTIRPMEDAP